MKKCRIPGSFSPEKQFLFEENVRIEGKKGKSGWENQCFLFQEQCLLWGEGMINMCGSSCADEHRAGSGAYD